MIGQVQIGQVSAMKPLVYGSLLSRCKGFLILRCMDVSV